MVRIEDGGLSFEDMRWAIGWRALASLARVDDKCTHHRKLKLNDLAMVRRDDWTRVTISFLME